MALDQTLDQAREELERGEIATARARLRGLVDSFPNEASPRALLAETYRRTGDRVQAGRWAFATETVTDEEVSAFTRGFANDPVQMMRALRWKGSEQSASSAIVRDRLALLKAAAVAAAGADLSWESARHPDPRAPLLVRLAGRMLMVFLVVALLVGIVTIVRTVFGWL